MFFELFEQVFVVIETFFFHTLSTPYPEPMLLKCLKTLLFVLLCFKVSNVFKTLLFQTLQQWKFSGLDLLAVGVLQAAVLTNV